MRGKVFSGGRGGWMMAVLGAVLLWCLPAAAAVDGNQPVRWQEVGVTLKPEAHLLAGRTTIGFAPGTRSATLRLARSARIDAVEVGGKKSPYEFANGLLSVPLPAGSGEVTVGISYHATFNDRASTSPAAAEDPSYGVNGTISREGTFLGDGSFWYPIPSDVPARRTTRIEAPAGVEGLTYGKRISRGTVGEVTRSEWKEANPVGSLSLVAGYYKIEERRVDGIDLYSYLYPDNASLSSRYLDAAARYIKFYSGLFGPFPFEKFAVVENFFPTGYGFPSFTLLGGSVIRLPFIIDTSFPHEIAHSWWGNGVGGDPSQGNWCEGLVTYLADYLLKERRSAAEGREYRRQLLIDYASLVSPATDFPLTSFVSRSDPQSRAIGYGKGAMLFHMIRTRIGDRAFFDGLRRVARERMYRSATWNDLLSAFSAASGENLAPFASEFLTRPGGPRLSLAQVAKKREGSGWVVSGVIRQEEPLYQLPVPLRLESAQGPLRQRITLKGEETPFTIYSATAPGRLLLDPEAEIFRIMRKGELPATVNSVKGASSLVGVITGDCKAGREPFMNLLASLSQRGALLVGEDRLDASDTTHDLIFCGLPADRSLLPPLPDGITATGEAITLDGERFAGPDALLVAVMPRPQAPGRVAALYLPLSARAALEYGAKITHYGKYGYLVFAGGSNRAKGTPSSSDPSVTVELGK
ncbi:M1 family peptidase [Geomonas sp. Red32]|uniref:M1 family metallopeptidase n=1 Tax=Geomonas sp. Red32 TaxID=2912856 RepID=UPI00202D0154|nr:M1 family aminopeptidase [Geomonas sp. Red32]MCM0083319.1 M1 family peptidase [Geomonas sp. Red32]